MRVELNVEALKNYMKEKGFTYSGLAREMGINRVSLYKVVNNKRGAGNEFIARLLHACSDLSFDDLFILKKSCPKEHNERGIEHAN